MERRGERPIVRSSLAPHDCVKLPPSYTNFLISTLLNCPQSLPQTEILISALKTSNISASFKKTFVAFNTECHIFYHLSKHSIKNVIKGIPTDISDSEMSDRLTNLNFQVKHLRRFSPPGEPLPIYLAILAIHCSTKEAFLVFFHVCKHRVKKN